MFNVDAASATVIQAAASATSDAAATGSILDTLVAPLATASTWYIETVVPYQIIFSIAFIVALVMVTVGMKVQENRTATA